MSKINDVDVFDDADGLSELLEKIDELSGMEVRDHKGNLLTTFEIHKDGERKWVVLR